MTTNVHQGFSQPSKPNFIAYSSIFLATPFPHWLIILSLQLRTTLHQISLSIGYRAYKMHGCLLFNNSPIFLIIVIAVLLILILIEILSWLHFPSSSTIPTPSAAIASLSFSVIIVRNFYPATVHHSNELISVPASISAVLMWVIWWTLKKTWIGWWRRAAATATNDAARLSSHQQKILLLSVIGVWSFCWGICQLTRNLIQVKTC